MSRGLWFVAGAGAGIYAAIRGRRAVEALSIEGLRDRLGALDVGARIFRDEVAQGKADKETELRERYGLLPHGVPELEAGKHRAAHPISSTNEVSRRSTNGEEEGSN